MKLAIPTLAALALLPLSCGGPKPLPAQPQIDLFPSGLYFGTDQCYGTYLNTIGINSLQISNGGQQPLVISGVSKSGDTDGVFQVTGPVVPGDGGSSPVKQLASGETAFIQVVFSPQAAKEYTATLTISSNAANEPTATIPLRGVGVADPTDGGTEQTTDAGILPTCLPDAG